MIQDLIDGIPTQKMVDSYGSTSTDAGNRTLMEVMKTCAPYWFDLEKDGGRFKPDLTSIKFHSDNYFDDKNFWVMATQHYTLAWSLYTLAYPRFGVANQDDQPIFGIPYGNNESSEEDNAHKLELCNNIMTVGFGVRGILQLAHLACEMALKCFLLHTSADKSFKALHNLKELMNELSDNHKKELVDGFKKWSPHTYDDELEELLSESGTRFMQGRYGQVDFPAVDSATCICLPFSRFIFSSFLPGNWPELV